MDAWSTIIGQRAMESICSIANEVREMPSLRDQFAMSALGGILANHGDFSGDAQQLSQIAYEYADAMLEARKKK